MTQIKVLLPELLARRRINRQQLAELTGLRYATLSDVYHGQSRPSLETLERVMQGLEQLTGQPVKLSELLEVVSEPMPVADPVRPMLDPAALKPFALRSRSPAPQVTVPTETLVAQIRGRD
jgi:transcriptional regulator with XRE-family HTH domain